MTSHRFEHFRNPQRWRRLAIVGLLLAGSPGPVALAQDAEALRVGGILYPRDAASKDPALARLRDALLEACRRQDVALLMQELADDARIGTDPSGPGREDAMRDLKSWIEMDPENFWRDLEDALTRGIALEDEGAAVAPYAYLADCGGECVVITGAGVKVRAAPSSSAPVVDVLAYDIVMQPEEQYLVDTNRERIGRYQYGWHPVITPSGKQGFVLEKYAYHTMGYRFFFKKYGSRWRVSGIHAGC